MLVVMRHVSTRPKSADRTYQQREYRKWLEDDRRTFMGKLADLEAKFAQEEVEKAGPDRGTEACVALIEQLLGEAGL